MESTELATHGKVTLKAVTSSDTFFRFRLWFRPGRTSFGMREGSSKKDEVGMQKKLSFTSGNRKRMVEEQRAGVTARALFTAPLLSTSLWRENSSSPAIDSAT